jgi:hypothetical protein
VNLAHPFHALLRHLFGARPSPRRSKRTRLAMLRLEDRVVPSGTWTALTNLAPGAGIYPSELLSNRDVLAHSAGLTPMASGYPAVDVDNEW